jgi:RimJ/RimL family protein N-acetyltransferase
MSDMHHLHATATSTQREGMLRLETARLVLRDWTPADIPDLIEGLNDVSVSRWLAVVPHPYTKAAAESWLAYCANLSKKGPEREQYEFAIELKAAQKVIGGVSVTRVSRVHGTAGGGIWLNARYQGQGYGTEAFGEKIRFAFVDLHLRRLENGFFKGNDASFALQQRFGYQLEGERRQAYHCLADGTVKDECITGLLKDEWKPG